MAKAILSETEPGVYQGTVAMLLLLAGFVLLLGILGGSYLVLGKSKDLGVFGGSRDGTLGGFVANLIVGIKRMLVNATSNLFKEQQQANQVRVVLLGMAGTGKSTLGNSLVFGKQYPDKGGFAIGHGMDSKTTDCQGLACQSGKGNMTVYDTPGVPDTDKEKTLERFNEVVRMVRGLPTINGIVFLLDARRQEANDYEAYRILFRQYTKLPCPIVMMCRVNCIDCPEDVKRQKEEAALELIDRVIEGCNLKSARVHRFLYRHGNVGKVDVKMLRVFWGSMPGVPVAEGTLMTSDEMEERLSRLSCQGNRIGELKKETSRLQVVQESLHAQIANLDERIGESEETLRKNSGWNSTLPDGMKISAVSLGLIDWTTNPILCALASPRSTRDVRIMSKMVLQESCRDITRCSSISSAEEIAKAKKEVESGLVDPKELENAREEYEELLKLTNR